MPHPDTASGRPSPPAPRRHRQGRGHGIHATAGLLTFVAVLAGACGASAGRTAASAPASSPVPSPTSGSPSPSSAPTAAGAPTTTVPAPTTTYPPPVAQPGWQIVAETSRAVVSDTRTVVGADGSTVTLVRFHAGHFRLDLHVGSEDPPSGNVSLSPMAQSVIGPAERPRVLGAFNGGFKMVAGAGGFEVGGTVLAPLVAGDASLVIDAGGVAHIGVWGQGLPRPGEHVVSVRQNLQPLVLGGAPSATVTDVGAWGATLGGVSATARSAVGTDAAGDLVYAAGEQTLPTDLASALVSAGVTTAMELDINPEWVQADVARHAGGTLSAAVPGQNRPSDQYLVGWSRDFLTVLRPY